jgi:hypothetical protein
MECCNELCTKDATGTCAFCEVGAEVDLFIQFWFRGDCSWIDSEY